jgi:hypothetical protein
MLLGIPESTVDVALLFLDDNSAALYTTFSSNFEYQLET